MADAIDAEGKSPTNGAVRERLGSGSYTTISASMKRWRDRKAERTAPPVERIPDALSEVAQAAISQIWTHAIKTAEVRLDEAKAQLETQREELEKGRQDAENFAELLNKELEDAKNELLEERRARSTLEEDFAKAQERAASELESERTRLSEAQQLAATLTGRLEATQTQLDALLARLGETLTEAASRKSSPTKTHA